MTVCPVCEHAQEASDECEVCGKRFRPGPAGGSLTAPPCDWLEPTRLREESGGTVALFAELEPTRHHPVAAVTGTAVPDFEPTAAAPEASPSTVAGDRERRDQALPDLEATAASPIPGERPTSVPATLVCRNCRTPADRGEFLCGRCGMRLPVLRPVAPPPPAPALTACPGCGTPGEGERCLACGGRRPRGG